MESIVFWCLACATSAVMLVAWLYGDAWERWEERVLAKLGREVVRAGREHRDAASFLSEVKLCEVTALAMLLEGIPWWRPSAWWVRTVVVVTHVVDRWRGSVFEPLVERTWEVVHRE